MKVYFSRESDRINHYIGIESSPMILVTEDLAMDKKNNLNKFKSE